MTNSPNEARTRVVICDDDPMRVNAWSDRLRDILSPDAFEIRPLSPGEFGQAVRALHERLKVAKSESPVIRDDDAKVMDEADVLIIDSDLTPDPTVFIDPSFEEVIDDYLVGEYGSNIARLARGYTNAGILVVVNHIYKGRTFDLTMRRFAELPADAYIAAPDLDNLGLWFGQMRAGFRPWSWPNIARMVTQASSATRSVTLDTTVLTAIGLEVDEANLFDDKQWERLLFDNEPPATASLRQVANSAVFGLGSQPGAKAPDSQLLGVAQSAIRRWLEHIVLPAQNVFVDLPHLIQDRPWLAGSARKDMSALNLLVEDSWTLPSTILLEAQAEACSSVLGHAVWRADRIPSSRSERLEPDDLVFCEDTSDFRPPSAAKEFSSDVDGQYRSRFVAKIPNVEYTPIRRLFAR